MTRIATSSTLDLVIPIGDFMLSDPLVINHGMAIATSGGVASNYRRTAIGKYSCVDGAFSSDQPSRLWITPNVINMGPSSWKMRIERDKNLAPVNGVQQKDDTARIDITVNANLRSFTSAELINLLYAAVTTFSVNFDGRIIAGES